VITMENTTEVVNPENEGIFGTLVECNTTNK
jgi:hypothetical protein